MWFLQNRNSCMHAVKETQRLVVQHFRELEFYELTCYVYLAILLFKCSIITVIQ